jgi:hypothetical protein
MRPHATSLETALRDVTTSAQLLDSLGQPGLATRIPGSLGVDDLLALADHEAAVRRHPRLEGEHVVLAAARVCDDTALYDEVSKSLGPGSPRRGILGWRPRARGRGRPRGDDSSQ